MTNIEDLFKDDVEEIEETPAYVDPDEDPEEGKIYKQLLRAHNKRVQDSIKDTECKHSHWIKKCSICQTILESDARVNAQAGEASKIVYSAMEKIVVRHYLAGRLKKLKVNQKSQLYWVEHFEHDIVTLRLKENVSTSGTEVTAAFTGQELCSLILDMIDPTDRDTHFKIARIADRPNELAKILIKLMRNKKV